MLTELCVSPMMSYLHVSVITFTVAEAKSLILVIFIILGYPLLDYICRSSEFKNDLAGMRANKFGMALNQSSS